jgi:hypothetical protein
LGRGVDELKDFMNKSQLRKNLMDIVLLLVMLLFVWILLIFPFLLHLTRKKDALIHFTRFEAKEIATELKQYSIQTGGLTNIDNNFVFQTVFGTNGTVNLNYHSEQTNSQGQVLDCWKTPYQIEILAKTNFVVTSAGPDKIFGDADDIIFNSVSNDFVKP